jgi:hypothetical protein
MVREIAISDFTETVGTLICLFPYFNNGKGYKASVEVALRPVSMESFTVPVSKM